MPLWIGAITIGLAFAFLAWGVYLSFRVLRFTDITVDGTFTLGAAVSGALIVAGVDPVLSLAAAILAASLAGAATGFIHTRFGVTDLLAGILMMTALYSVNLRVMGRSNLPLVNYETVTDLPARLIAGIEPDVATLLLFLALVALFKLALDWFLHTDFGMALRATGDNPEMITAQGVDTRNMKIIGLAIANGFAGLSGALIAHYQGFVDVNMGLGSLVAGIAAVIVGESLVGPRKLAWVVGAAAAGAVIYRLIIALALQVGLNPVDLKLLTAVFVLAALSVPRLKSGSWRKQRTEAPS
jgi:putative tryptophan/tyrosine transport system permease protein